VPFGVGDGAVERVEFDGVLFLHVHPATLAAEVARVDDRDIKEWREVFTTLDSPLELSTDNIPFTPKFHANFQRQRVSAVAKTR